MNVIAPRGVLFVIVSLCTSLAGAQFPEANQAISPSRAANANTTANVIELEVFGRGDSELSTKAATFATQLADRTNGLEVVVHDVLEDRTQLSRLWKLAQKSGRDKPVVPAFLCCGRLYFGFASPGETGPAIENLFTADVYTRSTCSRCIAAKAFLNKLSPQWPAVRFRIFEITGDIEARRRYEQLCRSRGQVPGLPTFHFAGQVIIGYQGDGITGARYVDLLRRVAKAAQPESPSRNDSSALGQPSQPSFAGLGLVSFWSRAILVTPALFQVGTDDAPRDAPLEMDDEFDLPDVLELPEEASAEEIGEAAPFEDVDQDDTASGVIDLPFFGEINVGDMGLPLFTFLVGLVDGFNPCAMWILVFLLSVLVNIKDRRKILLIAGTFVIVSGVAYFAFMAAWLNLFMLIGIARPAQVILGMFALLIGAINIKDFFAFKKGVSLSIPESTKPGLYKRVRDIVSAKYLTGALAGVIALAVVVNMVELLCTVGLPTLYTQILTMHELPVWKNYCYLALYISAYMLDDALLLTVVVVTLSHRKLQEREGRWLKLMSGSVILVLGLVMIFKPVWLQLGH